MEAEEKVRGLVGKTGNDKKKERDRQMVIGRRARASVGFTISFETLSMEAITDTGTSILMPARAIIYSSHALVYTFFNWFANQSSIVIWNKFIFSSSTAISGKTVSSTCDLSHCNCDMHYWQTVIFFRVVNILVIYACNILTRCNVYRAGKFASVPCALFLSVALRRAISCNHGAIKGDVTCKSQSSQSLSLNSYLIKIVSIMLKYLIQLIYNYSKHPIFAIAMINDYFC